MSISLHHKGLPDGVQPWDVIALVKFTAKLAEQKNRVSATAVTLMEYLVAACRKEDFQPGRMCGVWEQPSTIAANLGISTKVYHDAEAELRQRGFVVRTHNAHARRYGERRDGVIVQISGLSLAPLINGYSELKQLRNAIELKQQAMRDLRFEIAQIRRKIRELDDDALIQKAEAILPRGQASKIAQIEKLEVIKLDLVALLALIEVPSGDAKSCQQNEEFVSPYIPKRDSSKNRSAQREHRGGKKIQPLVTPALAARRASEDYQSTLDAMGGPTWPNIIEASSRACHWLGIAQKVWGEACMALGRERAALCVLIIDRNRRLPSNHRYHRKFACASLEGMVRKGAHNLNLIGFLRAMEGYPEGLCGKAAPLPRASQPCHQKGVHTVGRFVPVLMAKMQIVVEESKPC